MAQCAPERYTVGIGLTDRCNAQCPHCYSRPQGPGSDLDFDEIITLCEIVPLRSVNFGTGESLLYPRFIEVVRILGERDIDVAVTTNGSTILNLPDDVIRLFHDVDFSLDFPDPLMNDRWRGVGAHQAVMAGVDKCRELDVPVSLVACLMKENAAYMGKLAELALGLHLNLRVNVYKSVTSRKHQPSYLEFWSAIRDMASVACFSACSEPIVNAAIGNQRPVSGSPCGNHSFRIHPDGKVVPCVYLMDSNLTISDLIRDFDRYRDRLSQGLELPLPSVCGDCDQLEVCRGGCASRRLLNDPQEPDEYCFKVRDEVPQIPVRWKESQGLVHEDYLCTIIFSG